MMKLKIFWHLVASVSIPELLMCGSTQPEPEQLLIVPTHHLHRNDDLDLWFRLGMEQYVRVEQSEIWNFTEVITAFGEQKCILVVDNLVGVGFLGLSNPVLLRQPELALLQYSDEQRSRGRFREDHDYLFWVVRQQKLVNATDSGLNLDQLSNKLLNYSTWSRFHQNYPVFQPLDLVYIAAKHKPWRCQVHIQLVYQESWRFYRPRAPPIFWYPHVNPLLSLTLPSSTPSVKIQVCLRDHCPYLLQWLQHHSSPNSFEGHQMHISAILTYKNYMEFRWLHDLLTINVVHLHLANKFDFLLRHEWDNRLPQVLVSIRDIVLKPEQMHDIEYLSAITIAPNTNDVLWQGFNKGIENIFRDNAGRSLKYLYYCGNGENDIARILDSPIDKLAHGHIHIWHLILSNYTQKVDNPPFVTCVEAIGDFDSFDFSDIQTERVNLQAQKLLNELPGLALVFPLASVNRFSSLRFISCGERGFQPLPFQGLLDVFHKSVWILLLLVLIVIPNLLKYIYMACETHKKVKAFRVYALSALKVLLEQGDDLISSGKNPLRMKWIVSSYILVAVVLSNAYKSNNVYNMISERKPLPYENFQEIQQDNFKVYTRSGRITIEYPDPEKGRYDNDSLILHPHPHPHRISLFNAPHLDVVSEVSSMKTNSTVQTQLDDLISYSTLHPSLPEILKGTYLEGYKYYTPTNLQAASAGYNQYGYGGSGYYQGSGMGGNTGQFVNYGGPKNKGKVELDIFKKFLRITVTVLNSLGF